MSNALKTTSAAAALEANGLNGKVSGSHFCTSERYDGWALRYTNYACATTEGSHVHSSHRRTHRIASYVQKRFPKTRLCAHTHAVLPEFKKPATKTLPETSGHKYRAAAGRSTARARVPARRCSRPQPPVIDVAERNKSDDQRARVVHAA